MIKKGVRVVRGPNWKGEDQDGGEGHIGTVKSRTNDGKHVYLEWDTSGKDNKTDANRNEVIFYRAGESSSYDLRVFCSSQIGTEHKVSCSSCERAVKGLRFKCDICVEVNLCSTCYHCDQHDICHIFTRFDDNNHKGAPLSPRCYSFKCQVYDMKITDWNLVRYRNINKICYYRDHLPILGLPNEIEGKGPFRTGERVILKLGQQETRLLQKGHGGWSDNMIKFLDVIGYVVWNYQGLDKDITEVFYEGYDSTWTINNKALTRVGPFTEVDKVNITADQNELKRFQKVHSTWEDHMTKYAGKEGTISKITESGNLKMTIDCVNLELSPLVCSRQGQPIKMTVGTAGNASQDLGANIIEKLRVGHLVTRGPDWKWGNQDQNCPGVIQQILRNEKVVIVKWDHGVKGLYRMGNNDSYDLKLVDPNQSFGENILEKLRVGHLVTRGPDWKWGNQDQGCQGVIKKILRNEKVVIVKWDHGKDNLYRMGKDGQYDLKLVDPNQSFGLKERDDSDEDISEEMRLHIEFLKMMALPFNLSELQNRRTGTRHRDSGGYSPTRGDPIAQAWEEARARARAQAREESNTEYKDISEEMLFGEFLKMMASQSTLSDLHNIWTGRRRRDSDEHSPTRGDPRAQAREEARARARAQAREESNTEIYHF